jgi:penicillin-binding protein 2
VSSGPVSQPILEPRRLLLVYAVIAGVIVLLVSRLVTLQVVENADWFGQAVENYTASISVPAPRGIIYDRNGYVLARNIASYNVVITPANLPDDAADIQNIYRELSTLIEVPVNQGWRRPSCMRPVWKARALPSWWNWAIPSLLITR